MKEMKVPDNPLIDSLYSDYTRDSYSLMGTIFEANDILVEPHVIITPAIPYKGIISTLIDKHFKKILETYDVATDLVDIPNHFFTSVGFPERKVGRLTCCKELVMFPFEVVVQRFISKKFIEACQNTENVDYSVITPQMLLTMQDTLIPTMLIKDNSGTTYSLLDAEYHVEFIEDLLKEYAFDHDLQSTAYRYHNDKNEFCQDIAKTLDITLIYGSDYEFWTIAAELLNEQKARSYLNNINNLSLFMFKLLEQKYKEIGILLAEASFEFGLDYKGNLTVSGQIGTPDTCRFLSLAEYQKHGRLISVDREPMYDFFYKTGYDLNTRTAPPRLPKEVVDRISSTYIGIAKHFCGENVIQKYIQK